MSSDFPDTSPTFLSITTDPVTLSGPDSATTTGSPISISSPADSITTPPASDVPFSTGTIPPVPPTPPTPPAHEPSAPGPNVLFIFGVTIGAVVITILALFLCWLLRRRGRAKKQNTNTTTAHDFAEKQPSDPAGSRPLLHHNDAQRPESDFSLSNYHRVGGDNPFLASSENVSGKKKFGTLRRSSSISYFGSALALGLRGENNSPQPSDSASALDDDPFAKAPVRLDRLSVMSNASNSLSIARPTTSASRVPSIHGSVKSAKSGKSGKSKLTYSLRTKSSESLYSQSSGWGSQAHSRAGTAVMTPGPMSAGPMITLRPIGMADGEDYGITPPTLPFVRDLLRSRVEGAGVAPQRGDTVGSQNSSAGEYFSRYSSLSTDTHGLGHLEDVLLHMPYSTGMSTYGAYALPLDDDRGDKGDNILGSQTVSSPTETVRQLDAHYSSDVGTPRQARFDLDSGRP